MAGASVGSNASISKLRWIGLCLLERRKIRESHLGCTWIFILPTATTPWFCCVNASTLLMQQISRFPVLKVTMLGAYIPLHSLALGSVCLRLTPVCISDLPWALEPLILRTINRENSSLPQDKGSGKF